jgi:[protein-PII] uridylyltransferase
MTIVETPPSDLLALAERTAHVDHLVANVQGLPEVGCALLAVGGYGRRHLFPHSDIDLLLLFESERLMQSSKEAISAFLQRLWDAGLRMSHSVRTPAECLEVHQQNIELNVSLLDQRFVAGDRALYAELARRLPRFLEASREPLSRNLTQLARERHNKYANTFYHLEPNVKESPGGLRDYQLVCWLDQLRTGVADPSAELRDAFAYLARIRVFLHHEAGRDQNVLTFDAQDALAEHGHSGDAAAWMRGYYRHARALFRAATRALEANEGQSSGLFAQFRDRRSRLSNADFSVLRDRVHLRAPQRLDVQPEVVLDLFEFVGRHGIQPSFEAEQQIESRLPRLRSHFAELQPAVPLWPAIARILALPHAPLAIRAMHDCGVLRAIFPELDGIECLVVRDFYHRYTVDEHTLVAMQNLASAAGPYRELLAEVREPAVLFFALLFHDSGKGAANEGHVDAGLRLAHAAAARIRMPAAEGDTVAFLIRRHLLLSGAMQSRDVFDPQTLHDLAQQVETVERLKALTLLTYADISAVNPAAMTPWRADQLWQLYLMLHGQLTRELESERLETVSSEFLRGLPIRYLRTHSPEEIAEHIALEARVRASKSAAAVDLKRLEGAWQLTVVAADHPGLFAAAAGAISSFGMNILKAEAFANRQGMVLDTFTFEDPHRTLDLNPSEIDRLRSIAERAISGKLNVRDLLRNRPKKPLPSRKAGFAPRISFDAEASRTATLVEIVAEDRPGLLYDLASAISASGANIEVVLIDTQAHKAIDVFYLTAAGQKLDEAQQAGLGEALKGAISYQLSAIS